MKSLRLSLFALLFLSLRSLSAAPTITATQDDATAAATRKLVGETITYTTTISNTAPVIVGSTANDATGVTLTNPTPANTTDAGSVSISPIAFDDVYPFTVVPNIGINSAGASYSVLTNDFAGTPAVTTIASFTQPAHGTVTMVTAAGPNVGQFTYEPTAGYTGTDSFTYTLTNSVGSSVGTVNLAVSGPVVWFANPAAAAGGTGTLTAPFQTLAAANAAASISGQRIFLFTGSYTGGITLTNGVLLYGQGVGGATFDAVVLGITPPAGTNARPTINGTDPVITTSAASTNGINLAVGASNTIAGLTIGNKTGSGIASGASFGTLTIADTTINGTGQALSLTGGTVAATFDGVSSSSGTNGVGLTNIAGTLTINGGTINGPSGADFLVSGGNANITYAGAITNAAGNSINISGHSGGTILFSGAITDTGTGLSLTSNPGATISFTGGLSLSTGANPALTATGGGTVNATQNNTTIVNTLTTTTGTALNVSDTNIGASGITFRSITSTGSSASAGIVLNNTGATAGLTVTGNGGTCTVATPTCTGGQIANKTGADVTAGSPTVPTGGTTGLGIYLNNTRAVSLTRMHLNDFSNFAILGGSGGVVGFTLANSVVNGSNGNNDAADECSISFYGLTGSASVNNCAISGGWEDNLRVLNSSGTLNRLTVDTVIFGGNSASFGNENINAIVGGTGVFNMTVQNCTFTSSRSVHLQYTMNVGTPSGDVVVNNNTFSESQAQISGAAGIFLTSGGAGSNPTLSYNIQGNTISGRVGNGITVGKGSGTGSFSGKINLNAVGTTGVANSGGANGIALIHVGGGNDVISITSNTVRQFASDGIYLQIGDNTSGGNGTVQATVTGNVVKEASGSFPNAAFEFNNGTTANDAMFACLSFGGAGALKNDLVKTASQAAYSNGEVRMRMRFNVSTRLPGYGGGTTDDAAVASFAAGNNTTSGTGAFVVSHGVNTATWVGGAACSVPPLLFAPGGIESSGLSEACHGKPATVSLNEKTAGVPSATLVASPTTRAEGVETRPLNSTISQSELDDIVREATSRWKGTGLNPEQGARLRGMKFEVADLPGLRLGEADGNRIRVDNNAGGNGWFIGSDDAAFPGESTRRYTTPSSAPAGRIDLLTTIMHEMGHALGLNDSYLEQDRDNVMYGFLTKGERRFPTKGQAVGAMPNETSGPHFLASPVNLGTLPPGKTVKVVYSVTVGPITGNPQSTSSQGSVTSNIATVLTSDAVAGSGPTVTLLGIAPAFTSANATTFIVGTAGSFSVTANGAPAPTFTTSGLPSGVTLSAAGVLSGTPAAGTGGTYPITITANNGIAPNGTQSFTLTVNQAPAITSANATTFVVGTNGSFTVTKTGFPAPTLSQTGTLPSGVTFTAATGVLSGIPDPGTGGSYPISFTAANGVGSNAVQSFTLTVNQAPAITSANTTTFTVGTAGLFNVIATGFPSPAINLTNGALPAGVNFGTGTLAGTPPAYGTFPLTFTASNGVGSNAVQSFSLVVNPSASSVKGGGKISADVGGGFRVDFLGNPGVQYTVQFSPSLVPPNWQTLELKIASPQGTFFSIDNPPVGTNTRFYRAIIP